MEQKNELDHGDEIMLPGFRFHPTDEELVAFYLRRKVQKRPLSIELIKQLDIYKFDPWDLPKMASIGEKEWYFYCPRDRKYRNSNRPNRVTTAGFWKATGTDRPIYSSDGTNCIGLKKSLVFYKGRAAKGIKTDWMMHEFRLPTQLPLSSPCKRPLDKDLPPNDSWAICRIFKKSTVAQRVPHHMWTPPMVDRTFESSCNNNYSYTNIMDIPQLKTSNGDVQTHNASTNAIPSSIMAGTHEEFQFLNQQQPTNMAAFGSCKFSHAKSIPCFLPARSLSLPNLEYSNTSDQSHYNEHSAEKSTLNFVSYMLQMPPPADDVSKTHNFSPDISTNTDHHQQQEEAEAFLKKNSIFNSMIPMPGNISLCNSLPFQSNLYDVLKGVSTNQWDIPTSAIL